MQWVTAPPLSLVRTMLPYTLRDPYRMSHYTSPHYRALWPAAKDYLINLCDCGQHRGRRYDHARLAGLRADASIACAPRSGPARIPKRRCRRPTAEWDATTKRLGVEAQKAAYEQFLKLPGSYADHTIEKLGLAVHVQLHPRAAPGCARPALRAPRRRPDLPMARRCRGFDRRRRPARSRAAPYRNGSSGTSNG